MLSNRLNSTIKLLSHSFAFAGIRQGGGGRVGSGARRESDRIGNTSLIMGYQVLIATFNNKSDKLFASF